MDANPDPTHRTVALVGGPGSGKTTLAEALLFRSGAIPRRGSIEHGTTVCDHDPEEIARQTTLAISLAHMPWAPAEGTERAITLVDTPGHPDFIGGVDTALAVADAAAVVVSAVDGVTAGTRAVWAAAQAVGLPRIVVVTQEDRARADFRRVLGELRAAFGDHLWPLELPIGEEQDFHVVADLLSEHALVYDDTGHSHQEPVPAAAEAEEHDLHVSVTEEIVSHDDAQLEAYLDGNEPTPAELERTLAHEVASGGTVPVLLCSGLTGTGVDRAADLLCALTPAARDHDSRIVIGAAADGAAGTEVRVAPTPDGETVVHVFRTVADAFVGQIAMLKVLSGTLRPGDRLRNATTGAEERMPALFRLRGAQHLPADALRTGDVGAVAKLVGSPTGSVLWSRQGSGRPAPLPSRHPVYAVSLTPATQSDDAKLSTALARLLAEDPTLRLDRAAGQTLLRGLGETHVAVAVERLARVLGVNVTTGPAPVAYRETIARAAQAEGKLKKQSGGHGQFAVVQLRVSPLPPGGGFEFVDAVVGGAVPRSYIPAVEKGARDALAAGGPQGHPVVDVRVELFDGKSHSVDSSEMAFRTAASIGVKAALAEAGSVVLEPVSIVTITVPAALQGPVLTDLSSRRAHVNATESTDDGGTRIVASVPEAELGRYVLDLRSLTGGQGQLTITPDRYERAPSTARA
ncbi:MULTISPECIES: elongation factor G [unclassified Microbacterium]|uniref:elongation factor G n=1 Tax=unclassified Microbacterium TaxID=2609290 RepID=UPI00214AB565|nr:MULTISPECIES: elongation factor G [unclassified Microbacterium]MCR2811355.1 elongation factor G [Microbacterium sp. zg.B185]WIM18351.1 elongation factor G [Microbacterium sp. zg-B185]